LIAKTVNEKSTAKISNATEEVGAGIAA